MSENKQRMTTSPYFPYIQGDKTADRQKRRDLFAAAALTGLLSSLDGDQTILDPGLANEVWTMAEAMLEADK